jgi:choline-sulfatase
MHWSKAMPILGALAVVGFGAASCERGPADRENLPPNLLLVTIDTLRPDRLSHMGYRRATSPVIDGLVARGRRFENTYSQSGWTLPSVATIMTGRHPSDHGALDVEYRIRWGMPNLASILGRNGYETSAFVSHIVLGKEQGIARGFDEFDDSVLDVGHPHVVSTGSQLTDLAIDSLRELEEPFFLWVHYFDPHFSYLPHDAPWGTGLRARYDAEINFTDHQIGRLLEVSKQSGFEERTLVVVTSDHGEEFMEHGGHLHYSLYEEDIRNPLLFAGPGVVTGLDSFPAQQIDLLPTVLGLLGIHPPEGLPGQDLMAPDREQRPMYIERMRPEPFVQHVLIDGDKKLYSIGINHEWEGDLEERSEKTNVSAGTQLFDLAADPKERNNLYAEDDPESKRMLELLAPHVKSESAGADPRSVDEELQTRLRSLGYLE